MKNKKKITKKEISIITGGYSPFAKEMAIAKKGKGGAFEDKRFKKKNVDRWKQDVKNYS